MASSSTAVGCTSRSPSTYSRTVVAPTKDATFCATPRDSSFARYSAERGPVHRVVDVDLPGHGQLLHVLVQRAHRPAFAHDLQRHSLAKLALAEAVVQQRLIGPAEHVDEAGRDRLAGGVDLDAATQAARRADVGDAVVVDRDLARVRLAAAAVVDRAATNDDIVPGGCHARAGSAEAQRQQQRSRGAGQTVPEWSDFRWISHWPFKGYAGGGGRMIRAITPMSSSVRAPPPGGAGPQGAGRGANDWPMS